MQRARCAVLCTFVAALCAAGSISPRASAQNSIFASKVIAFDTKGNAGGGIFNTANALGMPVGAGGRSGSLHVHSLGTAGFLTLGFDVVITDGPGADFLVAENPFYSGTWQTNAETAFVEVSSDGVNFARIPAAYYGNPQNGTTSVVGAYSNLAGSTPVYANASRPQLDPQDVVDAGGDAFDLHDLVNDPLVLRGLVKLNAITQVRLVDVVGGVDLDSRGTPILDAMSSADIDAITVIHHTQNLSPNGPSVELRIPADGNFEMTMSDPDGIGDLDPASLHVAMFGTPIDPGILFGIMTFTNISATSFTMKLGVPLSPELVFQLAISVKDRAGNRSGAVRQRPDR